jgi:hypothetical protein
MLHDVLRMLQRERKSISYQLTYDEIWVSDIYPTSISWQPSVACGVAWHFLPVPVGWLGTLRNESQSPSAWRRELVIAISAFLGRDWRYELGKPLNICMLYMSINIYMYINVCICICICLCICLCKWMYVNECLYVCMYVRMYACIYIYLYIKICTYIFTYM